MTNLTSSRKPPVSSKTTTVFTSGNSQAVRLPKEFRVNTKTVEISRRGDEIVLREHRPTVGALMADLPPLSKEEAEEFDGIMKNVRTGLRPMEERDFSWMDDVSSGKGKSAAKRKRRT
jgi:antitoxin VapB